MERTAHACGTTIFERFRKSFLEHIPSRRKEKTFEFPYIRYAYYIIEGK